MKNYKSILSMCLFAALTNCGKSEVTAAQEFPNGRVVINDPDAQIGTGGKHIKTPWMIVAPDAKSGFANDFTTNAISVVSEDGTNYYAHIATTRSINGGNWPDRTKVIHFTVDKNGIPSRTGDVINTEDTGEEQNFFNMENRKLIGVKNGYLWFLNLAGTGNSLIYKPENNTARTIKFDNITATYQEGSNLYFLSEKNSSGAYLYKANSSGFYTRSSVPAGYSYLTAVGDRIYMGSTSGKVFIKSPSTSSSDPLELGIPISSLSNNGDEVFATIKGRHSFYNVTARWQNVIRGEDGNATPFVIPTSEELIRIIDNRKRNGKFLYVTPKGIHAIE